MTGIDKVIELAGGAMPLARELGVTHQSIYHWQKRGWVPAERAIQIESIYNIQREELVSPRLARVLGIAGQPA